tara:strand:- start:168 stop:302 length:135 start_codon:yes stop_codon:yes gene_type:complete
MKTHTKKIFEKEIEKEINLLGTAIIVLIFFSIFLLFYAVLGGLR